MKKLYFVILLTLTICSFSQEYYKFTYFNNYPPLSWEENGRVRGIFVDIINEVIYKRMGLTVSHTSHPWVRAQLMVEEEKADAFISIPTPERLKYTVINNEPVYDAKFTIFTNKHNKKLSIIKNIKSIEDIGDLKVVHYLGSGWAKKNFVGKDVNWTRTLDKSLLLLSLNRVDIFIDPSDIIMYNIKKNKFAHSIIEIDNIMDINSFKLCIRKNSSLSNYVVEIDTHLQDIKRDGTMTKILLKYR